jgi:hypothetical protein
MFDRRCRQRAMRLCLVAARDWYLCLMIVSSLMLIGCGTTRMSDTQRTGTEQILLSAAIDRSVNAIDFEILRGKDVYFDPQYLKGVPDEGYIVSSLRQRLLSEGVFLKTKSEDATYVVEARAGAVGTNRQDVLVGIPQTSLPTGALTGGAPSVIPEIPFAKKTHQKGVAKIAVFAYNQVTGQALWQSGVTPMTADARDTWFLGTGPFQRGSIYSESSKSGHRAISPLARNSPATTPVAGIAVNAPRTFDEEPDIVPPSPPESFTNRRRDSSVTPAKFTPGVSPAGQPQPAGAPGALPAAPAAPVTSSGFSSNTYNISGAQDLHGSSGGNAAAGGAAAGIYLYKNSTTKIP